MTAEISREIPSEGRKRTCTHKLASTMKISEAYWKVATFGLVL